ncbi:hypothetical protein EJ04DRAFT_558738 [Polyplosphaeria fusca]|uniref:Metallo-beta-lactamase domain-containing protein n=1 Tax=Polyplosphaeria fusca TaxID=682080 RepID=A0A9P4R834_9PLEO|nr:hypothetical protein EJ04DRAFT_558738 [Polyplosphaeria fusca]
MSSLQIPPSSPTVSVFIIDSTAWAYNLSCADLFRPPFKGLQTFDICSYSFPIQHDTGTQRRSLVFDLGIRKDWKNPALSMVSRLGDWGATITVKHHVAELIQQNGIDLDKVEAIIWSHLHWDHTGDPSTFPPSARLIVWPGIKDRYMPGWPTVEDASLNERDVANREIVGLSSEMFDENVGGFEALDYFGDGSFYILDAPGDTNALARTSTNPDTFIFLAADSVHLGGEFRPSETLPLPDPVGVPGIDPCLCPASALVKIHPLRSTTTPFLGLDPSFPEDLDEAERTIRLIQQFDADDRVFVVFAHDISIYDIVEFFPKDANDWKVKDWKTKGRWTFLPHLQKTFTKS